LAITFHLSKEPEDYVAESVQTLAAKQLAAAGIKLHAGETVRYVIANAKDKVKDWRAKPLALMDGPLEYDVEKYLELLERAASEILDGLLPAKRREPPAPGLLELPLVF
jgi:DNA polymerase elongation subunit (family B)